METLGDLQLMCAGAARMRMERTDDTMPTTRRKLATSKEHAKLDRRLAKATQEKEGQELHANLETIRTKTQIKVEE